jgi:hypothetical protein
MILKYLRQSLLDIFLQNYPSGNAMPTISDGIMLNVEGVHRFWHGCCFMRKPNENRHSQKQKENGK